MYITIFITKSGTTLLKLRANLFNIETKSGEKTNIKHNILNVVVVKRLKVK